MKKILLSIQLSFVLLLLSGCFEDKSSHGSGDAEVITVEGIESSYLVEARIQTLNINPTVSSNKPAEWEYSWGYMPSNYEIIEISDEKDLSHVFELEAKTWPLIFIARNTKTGIEKYVRTTLSLVTRYSRGWYVLKDDGVETDLNLYPSEIDLLPEDGNAPLENVLALINGESLAGTGVQLLAMAAFPLLDDVGSFTKTKSLMVLSSDDAGIYRQEDLVRSRDKTSISFQPWDDIRPVMGYVRSTTGAFFVNNGKMHGTALATAGTSGRFGVAKQLSTENPDYYLSEHYAFSSSSLGFDEISSSFISIGSYGDITYCTNGSGTEIDAVNNNRTCVYFGRCVSNSVGVFADKTTGVRQVLKITLTTAPVITVISTLSADDKLNSATIIAAANEEEVMYFVDAAGDVYSRMLNAAGTETLEFDVPSDETVTFIRQIRHYNTALPLNYISVATVKGAGASATYMIRFFDRLGGHFENEIEELRLTGKGTPRDVYFVNPLITSQLSMYYNYLYR